MAIDPALTAAFQATPRAFMKNHLLAARGMGIPETTPTGPRPQFPASPTAPLPHGVVDDKDRADRNYRLTAPIIMGGGIEHNSQYDGYTKGRTRLQLHSLRIAPLVNGVPPAGMFPIYYLPYADDLAYTMQLDSGPGLPRLFCTEAINGCSFQVAGDVRRPIVTHANVQGTTLTQEVKAGFLEFFLDTPRRAGELAPGSAIAARLQRFNKSSTAQVSDASVVKYGAEGQAEFNAQVTQATRRTAGTEVFTTMESGRLVTYEAETIFTEMNGKPLDPTGGEVAVIGYNPNGVQWLFFWSMYVPVKSNVMYYRRKPTGGREFAHTMATYDFVPLVSGRFLWPDWAAGTPYSVREGHLGR
jgi:hypothetical protein